MLDLDIEAARRFTRFYTRQTDLLNESLSESGFSLSESRVLYELATRGATNAAELSRELGLDPGYLSRMLRSFGQAGWLDRQRHAADGRQATLSLTEAGQAAFAPLEAGSRADWHRRLAPLSPADRQQLLGAMATLERLLGPAQPPSGAIVLRGHGIGDLGWIARRQALLYAAEYGWDVTYEALAAEILAKFVREFAPGSERAWIAERDGAILGSVFLVRASDEVGRLRLLYVEPEARGLGLGRRLVGECIGFARTCGYRRLILWTNDCLVAARRIYEAAGFVLDEEQRHHSFGRDLVGQSWSLDL